MMRQLEEAEYDDPNFGECVELVKAKLLAELVEEVRALRKAIEAQREDE
jgi:hypothetical protein